MGKKELSIEEQLRGAIREAEKGGLSRYQIAKAAGIPQSQLQRIADGENLPRIDTAARIAKALKMVLTMLPK